MQEALREGEGDRRKREGKRRRQLRTDEGDDVLYDCLGDAEATQAFDARELSEARVLQPAHRQRLAHVARGEVVACEHPRVTCRAR